MDEAIENDADLMTEVKNFWIEPAFHYSRLSEGEISWLALAVVRWLRVRLIQVS